LLFDLVLDRNRVIVLSILIITGLHIKLPS
jgi:hypothetical protein